LIETNNGTKISKTYWEKVVPRKTYRHLIVPLTIASKRRAAFTIDAQENSPINLIKKKHELPQWRLGLLYQDLLVLVAAQKDLVCLE
jgi:hypothetical protein